MKYYILIESCTRQPKHQHHVLYWKMNGAMWLSPRSCQPYNKQNWASDPCTHTHTAHRRHGNSWCGKLAIFVHDCCCRWRHTDDDMADESWSRRHLRWLRTKRCDSIFPTKMRAKKTFFYFLFAWQEQIASALNLMIYWDGHLFVLILASASRASPLSIFQFCFSFFRAAPLLLSHLVSLRHFHAAVCDGSALLLMSERGSGTERYTCSKNSDSVSMVSLNW